jgi:hypothetical protein
MGFLEIWHPPGGKKDLTKPRAIPRVRAISSNPHICPQKASTLEASKVDFTRNCIGSESELTATQV